MASRERGTVADSGSGEGARLRKDERRNMLLDMAAEIAVSESPNAVTMDLVAERCGVSRPLVYKHFANRDEILGELYRREARRLHAELAGEVDAAPNVEAMFRALVRGALRAAAERGHVFGTLRNAGAGSRQVRTEQRARDALTAKAFTERAIDELDADPRRAPTTISLLLAMIDPVLTQWRQDPTPERAEKLEDAYLRIVSASLSDLARRTP